MKRRREDRDDHQERQGASRRTRAAEWSPWPPIRSLVVGGREAAPGQFPYQAGLLILKPMGILARCAAVLISDRWLITAAHCCYSGLRISVFLGSANTLTDAEQKVASSLVLLHPEYSPNIIGHNDLALIRLANPVRLTKRVQPVRLPWKYRNDSFEGREATLSGWGKTSDLDPLPSMGKAVLRFATERILSNKQVEITTARKIPPSFLIAKGPHGSLSCNGDSGGPLTVRDADGAPLLVGIVSHRFNLSCENSPMHTCTRVTSFLPWIASATDHTIRG